MNQNIQITDKGPVREIRIQRPEKKNALNTAMYGQLADAVAQTIEKDAIRCIVFVGAGGAFSSGNDIQDFLDNPASGEDHPVARFMRVMADFPKPAVAGVVGPAVGIGSTLLLHCDLIYAGKNARFMLPFVNLGICPEFASSLLLPRMMGHPRAAELTMLAEPFDAAKALEYGLINAILDDDKVEEKAFAVAEALAAKPPKALRTTKALLKRWTSDQVQEAIREEAALFMPMLHEPEAREAFSAFVEKRKPDFSQFA